MTPGEHTAFDDRAGWNAAVLRVAALARRTIDLVDRDLRDWPFETRDGDEALRAALRRGVRMRVLLADPERVARTATRFLRANRDFSARLACRCFAPTLRIVESAIVVDGEHVVRRAHFEALAGTCVIGGRSAAAAVLERIDAAWPESEPCLPGTTLGL